MSIRSLSLALLFTLGVSLPGAGVASEQDRAQRLCTDKIRTVYGVDKFRNVWAERLGNHKFRVHGKVKMHHELYPLKCIVKHGHIKSYAYHGPNPRHDDHDDDDSNLAPALAIGAGLAIIVAMAAADHDSSDEKSSLPVQKSVLEDDCHDQLRYRIRDEHDYRARVHLTDSRVDGHDLRGHAKVKYDGTAHHANFTCHFHRNGRIKDAQYYLY